MNKKAGAGIAAAAVVVVAGVLGTSYYMGGKLEQGFQDAAAKWSRDGLKIQVLIYERGTFTSTAKTVWTYERGGEDEPLQFTADHQISHGPLPRGHAAEVHTLFRLPDDAGEDLKAALAGRAPVELTTKVGWTRSTSNLMTSPVVTGKIEGSDLNWGGMKIEWDMPADMKAAKGTASFPSLQFKGSEGGSMAMESATMRFDLKQPQGQQFWTGPFAVSLAKLAAQPEDADKLPSFVQDLSLDTDTVLQNDVVEVTIKGGIKSAQLEDRKADDLALEVAFHNIDSAWINQAMELGQRRRAAMAEGEESEEAQAEDDDLRNALMKGMTQALARKPEIEIKRLAMRTKDGVSELGAAFKYQGDGSNMSTLFKDLKLSLHAQLPKAVMEDLIGQRARRSYLALVEDSEQEFDKEELDTAIQANVKEQMDALLERGVFEDKAGIMTTQMQFENGEIKVNGKPLDTLDAATLMGSMAE